MRLCNRHHRQALEDQHQTQYEMKERSAHASASLAPPLAEVNCLRRQWGGEMERLCHFCATVA